MKVLVIDDTPEQRDHALTALAGHEVTVASGWTDGKKAIEEGGWDAVLTDLTMPAVADGQGEGQRYVGEVTPYGFPLALLALKAGISKIAIVSNGQGDANHHSHPIFWSADSLHGQIIPGRLWGFTGYDCPCMNKESMPGIENPWRFKDWGGILNQIVNGTTEE